MLCVSLMLSFAAGVHAGPVGGVVAAGGASIATSGARTTITQTTQNAAVNWQSFGIAAGETVQFAQPNASSVALNRVLGSDASAIFGRLDRRRIDGEALKVRRRVGQAEDSPLRFDHDELR